MTSLTYVGNPSLRNIDGAEKVTGHARYVGDMAVPGMAVGRILRSPVAHARIVELDVTPALVVSGVRAAITHRDFVDDGAFGWPVRDATILAYHKVRYVGDPVAAVVADTAEAAQAGIEAIRVVYEPLPVVADMAQALDAGFPQIPAVSPTGQGNLCATHLLRNGDPDPLLSSAAVLFEATYQLPHQEHSYLETEGALAIPEPHGGVTVYANCQSPHIARDTAAQVLGLGTDKVRVIQPPVGGAFGGKDDIIYQTVAQAAKLALLAGCPVRIVLTRSESMAASYKREAMQSRILLAADDDGTLRAAKVALTVDSGAYASMTPMVAWRATMHAAGAYRYQAVHVDAQVLYTNNGYSGAFRGFGNTPATAAVELAIDELAERMGRDPLEFRLRNCLRQGDRTMTGDMLDQAVGLAACLEWVRDRSDWATKRATYADLAASASEHPASERPASERPASERPASERPALRRGIGVACYFHGSGLGGEGVDFATATIAVEHDYGITLTCGLTDYGQGSRTVFALLAAETLGVTMARIHVLRPDTRTASDSGPTVASRASIVGGNAVRITAQKIAHLLDLAAADLFQCTPERLTRHDEQYIGPAEEPVSFETVVDHARAMGLRLSAEGRWQVRPIEWDFEHGTGKPYFAYVFGAQVAEVEVDPATGRTRVLAIWAAHDAGTILYPKGAFGQMYGGVAQGLGYALMEDFRFENGVPQALDFDRYRIPRATDVPDIQGTYIQTAHPDGPYGAKNLAEPVMIGTAPAIANAFAQATGRRVRGFPLPRWGTTKTPENAFREA